MKKLVTATTMAIALFVGVSMEDADASSTYTVKSGDTLYQIALNHNASVSELKSWNNLSSDIIYPNQELNVTGSEAVASASSQSDGASSAYTVKSGDTLYKIATKHDISVSELKSWNNLSSNTIHPNQELTVTGSASVSSSSSEKNTNQQSEQKADREMTFSSTAYTANCSGCSGVTATGINLKSNPDKKVIAVDPDVIPLGTEVYVEGYGTAVAGDTGGAVKGDKIDVFFSDRSEALQWGRKKINIKILQ
ncbi:LysM peptidoglycan-binding domain-containing protein [Alteribacillus sp. JSM 102045]|uniref:LysM peptidoglycan-binding and 3D domain-containing protein n=1 Tax=Alteribacillus sp. JSM 102045 TaxID=1562101 RepID=UPI0035C24B3C